VLNRDSRSGKEITSFEGHVHMMPFESTTVNFVLNLYSVIQIVKKFKNCKVKFVFVQNVEILYVSRIFLLDFILSAIKNASSMA